MKVFLNISLTCALIVGAFSGADIAWAANKLPPNITPATIKHSRTSAPKAAAVRPMTSTYKIDRNLSIAGSSTVPKEQAVKFIRTSAPDAKLNCSVEQIVDHYYKEAAKEGIRGDVALAQALVETGFFKYGGSVNYRQNNFCGLGTTSNAVRGASFPTPQIGVRAHIQHLLVYSSKDDPKERIVDPRFNTVKKLSHLHGTSKTWNDLAGRWAMDKNYGTKVLTVYARMADHDKKSFRNTNNDEQYNKSGKDEKSKKSLQERIDDILRGA